MPPVARDLVQSAASSADDTLSKLGQSGFTSDCIPMAVACGSAGLIVGVLVVLAVVYKCKRDKAELQKKIVLRENELEKRKTDEQETMAQVVTTLQEQVRRLEEMRDQLKEQLEEVEMEKEENKRKLQSVEREITEREKIFDKPEGLLVEKDNLLKAQWEIDMTKKNYEKQKLNVEKLLEPIEFQLNKMKRRDVKIWVD